MQIEEQLKKLSIDQSKMYFRPISTHELYQQKINPLIVKMSEGIENTTALITHLREFKLFTQAKRTTTNESKLEELQFTALIDVIHSQQTSFKVLSLFSLIAKFILSQEQHFATRKIEILQQNTNNHIKLSKIEVIYILGLMALNLVPLQDYDFDDNNPLRRDKFPLWNDFSHIFSTSHYKTKTVLAYFDMHLNRNQWIKRNQTFVIRRKCLQSPVQKFIMQTQDKPMTTPQIQGNNASIEQFTGKAKVDFANKFIGGGALHDGCVQEEIMFSNHPELFISGIFCQVMQDDESIYLEGFNKYSKNKGYGFSVSYDGQQEITQETFKTQEHIIAIDAIHFLKMKAVIQFDKESIDRELAKAYAGFSNLPEGTDVVTGNWGCGVFNGDIRTKFIIQWLACSMADRKMIYCPFGSNQLLENNRKVIERLCQKTVGEVYVILIKAGKQMQKAQWNIFQLINQIIEQKEKLKAKI